MDTLAILFIQLAISILVLYLVALAAHNWNPNLATMFVLSASAVLGILLMIFSLGSILLELGKFLGY